MAARHLYRAATFMVLACFTSCTAVSGPTSNYWKLNAIAAEARLLMESPRREEDRWPQERDWPPTIASLKPDFVIIYDDEVHIVTIPYFDGGWGYMVRRAPEPATPPEPQGRFSNLGQGVYWFHPY